MRAYVVRQYPGISDRVAGFLQRGGGRYLGIVALLAAISTVLLVQTVTLRYRLEVTHLALADRLDDLDGARRNLAVSRQMLHDSEPSPAALPNRPYLVISIAERRLWYKQQDEVLVIP